MFQVRLFTKELQFAGSLYTGIFLMHCCYSTVQTSLSAIIASLQGKFEMESLPFMRSRGQRGNFLQSSILVEDKFHVQGHAVVDG